MKRVKTFKRNETISGMKEYIRKPLIVSAILITEDFCVQDVGGLTRGSAGDYLAKSDLGLFVIPQQTFYDLYSEALDTAQTEQDFLDEVCNPGVTPEEKEMIADLTNGDILREIAPNAPHDKADRYAPHQAEEIMLAKLGSGMVDGEGTPASINNALDNGEKRDTLEKKTSGAGLEDGFDEDELPF